MKKMHLSPAFIGFLQTVGFLVYIAFFAVLMTNASALFGPMNQASLLGPMLLLSLFVFSAIICASTMLGYPFYVFWERKDFKTAAAIIGSSVFWLFIFIVLTCILLVTRR